LASSWPGGQNFGLSLHGLASALTWSIWPCLSSLQSYGYRRKEKVIRATNNKGRFVYCEVKHCYTTMHNISTWFKQEEIARVAELSQKVKV